MTGWVSILHRVTGVILFLAIPACLGLLQQSLDSAEGFADTARLLSQPLGRLLTLLVMASLVHHLLSGLRHLALDMHLGVGMDAARRSAWWVVGASALVTLLIAGKLFL